MHNLDLPLIRPLLTSEISTPQTIRHSSILSTSPNNINSLRSTFLDSYFFQLSYAPLHYYSNHSSPSHLTSPTLHLKNNFTFLLLALIIILASVGWLVQLSLLCIDTPSHLSKFSTVQKTSAVPTFYIFHLFCAPHPFYILHPMLLATPGTYLKQSTSSNGYPFNPLHSTHIYILRAPITLLLPTFTANSTKLTHKSTLLLLWVNYKYCIICK